MQNGEIGARSIWDVWPAGEHPLTTGVVYTPLHPLALPPRPGPPVRCAACSAVLHPFCDVDAPARLWTCSFCFSRMPLPPALDPAALQHAAVEHLAGVAAQPGLVLVVDAAARDTAMLALAVLPPTVRIGLVTFGAAAHVYDCEPGAAARLFAFRSAEDARGPDAPPPGSLLRPLGEIDEMLAAALGRLGPEPPPTGHRPARATGIALAAAVHMLTGVGGRVLLLTGGPCTRGGGAVVAEDLREVPRGWSHIESAADARQFYADLACAAGAARVAVDVLAASLHEVGLYEMQDLVRATGGVAALADNFENAELAATLRALLADDALAFDATLEVRTSQGTTVRGAVGACANMQRATPSVCQDCSPVGLGGTSAWRFVGLDSRAAVGLCFDVARDVRASVVQIETNYTRADGTRVLRVATMQHGAGEAAGFDAVAALGMLARIAAFRADDEPTIETIRWVDCALIQACRPPGLPLGGEALPEMVYHMRRGALLRTFARSPDETVWMRMCALRADADGAAVLACPRLTAHSLEHGVISVPLVEGALHPQCVFVLDLYVRVVVILGAEFARWVEEGYEQRPEYTNLRDLLAGARAEAAALAGRRVPVPRVVECAQGGSLARYLLAALTPTSGDEVPLQRFLEHLGKAVREHE